MKMKAIILLSIPVKSSVLFYVPRKNLAAWKTSPTVVEKTSRFFFQLYLFTLSQLKIKGYTHVADYGAPQRNCAAIRLLTGLFFDFLSSTRVVRLSDGRGSNDAGGGTPWTQVGESWIWK